MPKKSKKSKKQKKTKKVAKKEMMHKMPNGMMMKDSEMKKMMGKKASSMMNKAKYK